jgi:hypothetical protein
VHALYPAYASHAPQFAPRRERIWLYSRIEKSLRLDLAGLRIRRRRAEALELPNHSRGALRLGLSGDGWGFATNSVVVGDGSDGLIVSQARDHATYIRPQEYLLGWHDPRMEFREGLDSGRGSRG